MSSSIIAQLLKGFKSKEIMVRERKARGGLGIDRKAIFVNQLVSENSSSSTISAREKMIKEG